MAHSTRRFFGTGGSPSLDLHSEASTSKPSSAKFEEVLKQYRDEQGEIDFEKQIDDFTVLHHAALFNQAGFIRQYCPQGVNFSVGLTPFHLAIRDGYPDVVDALCEKGANVNVQNHKGETPLYFAVEKHRHRIVEKLLTSNADTNLADKDGWTPFHVIATKGDRYIGFADLLLNSQPNTKFDEADINGETPLHFAAKYFHVECLNKLVQLGADVEKRTAKSETPLSLLAKLDFAGSKEWVEAMQLLTFKVSMNYRRKYASEDQEKSEQDGPLTVGSFEEASKIEEADAFLVRFGRFRM